MADNGDGVTGIGDIIRYTINVKNTGNISLSGLALTDNLSDVNGGALSLSSGPSFSGSDQGSPQGTLKVSETATYMAMYIVPAVSNRCGWCFQSSSSIGEYSTECYGDRYE